MNTEFETGASPAAASKPWLFLSVIIGALYLLFPTWIAASHLFLLLIVIAAVVTFDRKQCAALLWRVPVLWVLLALFAAVLLGALYSPASWDEIKLHWLKYLRFIYPVFILLLIASDRRLQKVALMSFVAAMAFIVVSTWLNVWFVLPWSASKIPGWGRNHFVIGDHITQNVMVAFFVVICLQKARERWATNIGMLWASAAVLGAISITHLSFGRTGVLVLIAGICCWLPTCFSGRKLLAAFSVLAILFAGGIWSSSAMTARIDKAKNEVVAHEENKTSSIGHRLYNQKTTIRMIADAPLIGHGTGSYHSEICAYLADPAQCGIYAWHPHNQFLLIGAEHGLLGLALYAALFVAMFIAAKKSGNSEARGLLFALTAILLVDSLINSPFFSSRESQFFSYMIALMLALNLGHQDWRDATNAMRTD